MGEADYMIQDEVFKAKSVALRVCFYPSRILNSYRRKDK